MYMSKRSKRRKSAKKHNAPTIGRGFDFGFLPRMIYANESSMDFNQHAIAANIFGCAYGYDRIDGYPAAIPCMTLIGENPDELNAAAKCLENWGCAADGDAVDINIVLKNDGGYLLGVQPEQTRLANRYTKDQALADALYFGATWIKTLDSTNPILYRWQDYLESKLSPIKIMFGTATSVDGMPQINTVKELPGAVSFIKFRLKIETEQENPSHWFFSIVRKQKNARKPERDVYEPSQVAAARKKVIDTAFPLSRERIRRLNLHERIKELTNFEGVSPSQIDQAVINVQLSREWSGGLDHYVGIKELDKTWWQRISGRIEYCGNENIIADIPLVAIARQMRLDVEYVVHRHGATLSPTMKSNQRLFSRLGYGSV